MTKSYKVLYLASILISVGSTRAVEDNISSLSTLINDSEGRVSEAMSSFFNEQTKKKTNSRFTNLAFEKGITRIYCDPKTPVDLRKKISDILDNPPKELKVVLERGFNIGGNESLAQKTTSSIETTLQTNLINTGTNVRSYNDTLSILATDSSEIAKRVIKNTISKLSEKKNYTEIFKLITAANSFDINKIRNKRDSTTDPILKMVYEAAGVVKHIQGNNTYQVKSWLGNVANRLQENDIINQDPKLWFTIANTCTNAILGAEAGQTTMPEILDARETQLETLHSALEGTLTIKGKVSGVASKAGRWFKNVFNYTKLSLNIRSKFRSNSERYNMATTLIGDFDRVNATSIQVYNESGIDIALQPKIPALFQQISVVLQNLDDSPVSDALQKQLIGQLLELDSTGTMIHQEIIQHLPTSKMKTAFLMNMNEIQNKTDLTNLKKNNHIVTFDMGDTPTELPKYLKPTVTSYKDTTGGELNGRTPATTTTPRTTTTEGRTSTTTLSPEEEQRRRRTGTTENPEHTAPSREFDSTTEPVK